LIGARPRDWRVGGVSVHTGTIPSKTPRETVLNLSGWRAGCLEPDDAMTFVDATGLRGC